MNDNRRNKLPLSVADILADDILGSSDEEIISEAQEKYDDVETEITKTRNIINSAIMKSKKSRLAAAKEQLASKKTIEVHQSCDVLLLSISEKLKLINQAKESEQSLTLAARNEEVMSESDIDGVLENLFDLGVIDKDGNIK